MKRTLLAALLLAFALPADASELTGSAFDRPQTSYVSCSMLMPRSATKC